MQSKDLLTVMDLLSVSEHHARTLLIHYRWDVDKVIEVYVEKGKSCMFSEAGLSIVELIDLDQLEPSSMVMCIICIENVPAENVTKMDCGHCFCNNCKHLFLYWLLKHHTGHDYIQVLLFLLCYCKFVMLLSDLF